MPVGFRFDGDHGHSTNNEGRDPTRSEVDGSQRGRQHDLRVRSDGTVQRNPSPNLSYRQGTSEHVGRVLDDPFSPNGFSSGSGSPGGSNGSSRKKNGGRLNAIGSGGTFYIFWGSLTVLVVYAYLFKNWIWI